MASLNTFVDEHISIAYSVEYQLHVQPGYSYTLSRGNQLLHVDLLSREDWEWRKKSAFTPVVPMPGHESSEAPSEKRRVEESKFGEWHGKSLWWELVSQEGKLLINKAFFFLEDESRTIHVRMDDNTLLSRDVIATFLSNISFPGQATYEATAASQQAEPAFHSPYAVSLAHFANFGATSDNESRKYNINFTGESFSDEQRVAVDRFVDEESALSNAVLTAIHAYYVSEELPVLKGVIPPEFLPEITSPEDMVQQISLTGLHVHTPRMNGDIPIGLSFDASWTENDVGVRVVGSTIEAVGTAYTALEEE